jgi:hypothetical protein
MRDAMRDLYIRHFERERDRLVAQGVPAPRAVEIAHERAFQLVLAARVARGDDDLGGAC